MNLLLFLLVITVSFLIVRIGAIAFNLTGLEWSLAKFQALSCFSTTGFTTRESELIVSDPKRRQVASVLMVLGNAGLVTLVATFANSMRPRSGMTGWQIPFINFTIPAGWFPLLNLIVIVLVFILLLRLLHSPFGNRLTSAIRKRIIRRQEQITNVSFEDLTIITSGFGVVRMHMVPDCDLLNKTILDSGLKNKGILILAVIRGSDSIPNPPITTVIQQQDELVCFGQVDNIRNCFAKKDTAPKSD